MRTILTNLILVPVIIAGLAEKVVKTARNITEVDIFSDDFAKKAEKLIAWIFVLGATYILGHLIVFIFKGGF